MTNEPALRRDRRDALFAGVCSALARTWDIDPLLVRVGFVVLTLLTGGFALAAYFVLWALIPATGGRAGSVRQFAPLARTWSDPIVIKAVLLAAVVLGVASTGVGAGALMIGVITLLIFRFGLVGRRSPSPAPDADAPLPQPRTEFERAALAWQQRVDNVASGRPADWVPPAYFTDPDPMGLYAPGRPSTRRRDNRTWLGVGVGLGISSASLAGLDAVGVAVPPLAWASATLAVLGLALVAVARPGRAARGRPFGLVTATVVVGLATVGQLAGDVAAPMVAPTAPQAYTAATLPTRQHVDLGSSTVDLSGVTLSEDRTLELTVDVGDLTVVLPERGNVILDHSVDMGAVQVATEPAQEGMDLTGRWERAVDPDAPVLTLHVSVDVGRLTVVEP